jgi:predicted acetyltransferase
MHNDMETRIRPLFMGRVVDAPRALEALAPEAGAAGEAVVRIADPVCEWNDGVFTVALEGGRVSVERTDRDPGIALDIQALTQSYWGHPSSESLRQIGRISVSDEAQYHLWERLFPARVSYIQDFF